MNNDICRTYHSVCVDIRFGILDRSLVGFSATNDVSLDSRTNIGGVWIVSVWKRKEIMGCVVRFGSILI